MQVNASLISLFLDEVARRHSDEFVFMVMDGAGDQMVGSLMRLEKSHDTVASLAGFHWIINIPLNAT